MTLDQRLLSRQLAELPGFRRKVGMRFSSTGTPDLNHDATGGVLLGWLAKMGAQPDADYHDGRWRVDAVHTTYFGATLAEACARALLFIGRCP